LPTTADNENAQALAAAHATPLALVVGRASSGLRTRPSIAHGVDAYAPVMQVLALRVAWLLRRHWRATLAFALAAGLAGGLSMAAWASARRTEHVFSEFLAAADLPELTVTFCPPDVSDVDDADLVECLRYDPEAEVEVLRSLPEVAGADRAAVRTGLVRANDRGPARPVFISAMLDPGGITPVGRPVLLEGTLAAADAPDEVMVNEAFVRTYGVGLSDQLLLRAFTPGEDDRTAPADLRGPELALRIVGVVRTFEDLSALNRGGEASVAATVFTRPGVDQRMTDAAPFFAAVLVQARDGDAGNAHAAVERAFPGRVLNNQYEVSADDVVPLRDAYGYEADAARAVALLLSIGSIVFVGQALARQSRREWADLAGLRAIGLSARQAGLAAGARGLVIGAGAAVVAAIVATALSAFTPLGSARQAELDPGMEVDPLVSVVGAVAVLLVVVAMAAAPVWRAARAARAHSPRPLHVLPATAPTPPLTAGLGLAVNGGRAGAGVPVGTAIVGVALAVGVIVASAGLVASLTELVDVPSRFGATWDLSIGSLQQGEPEGVRDRLQGIGGIERAGALLGTELIVGTESLWATAIEPVGAALAPVTPAILRGREPIRADEIGLGELTRARLGVQIGDQVPVAASLAGARPLSMTVVGTAVINSTDEGSPGLGAVLSPEGLRELLPAASATTFVVDLRDGEPGRSARTELEASFEGELSGPVRQPAVRNLERLRRVPWLLAAIVVVLAAGSLAHALVLLIGRQRRQLAVLKTLGFTPRQVSSTVAWQATALVVVAAVVGAVGGALVARIGWRAVVDRLGVVSPAVVPPFALALVILGAVVFANLVAIWPGRRAAAIRVSEALRSE
jgi:ABC-type lipoprotein release transport system permease subunit